MARYWPTVLLAGIFAGLGLYLYFVELPEQRTELVTATQAKQILPFKQAQITALRVRSHSGEVVLNQSPGRPWNITAPIETDADQRQVQALLRALVTGKVSRLVETHPASLTPFGLDHPSTVVTESAGDRDETLSIGDAGPLSSTLYVLRASDAGQCRALAIGQPRKDISAPVSGRQVGLPVGHACLPERENDVLVTERTKVPVTQYRVPDKLDKFLVIQKRSDHRPRHLLDHPPRHRRP